MVGDKKMIKRIKQYFAIRKARKRAVLLGQMIASIDRAFEKQGIPRHKRRQFWQDFIHSEEARKRFIQTMRID